MKFTPNKAELKKISKITSIYASEYALIRLTPTMLSKSIMDASWPIRDLLQRGNIVNFGLLPQGPEHKIVTDVILLSDMPFLYKASFYRPLTKKGDPRFWIYGIKKNVNAGDMIFLTIYKKQLVIIPLSDTSFNPSVIQGFFGIDKIEKAKRRLINRARVIYQNGFIKSVGKGKKISPKDIGETFEQVLGILPNSNKSADFEGLIEIKGKREGVKTSDTLFSMVPDYKNSPIPSSTDMLLSYGYPSKKHEGFIDLYVTVSNKPNPQGLYLYVDEEKQQIVQMHVDKFENHTITCIWHFDDVKKRLFKKHPSTLWVIGESMEEDGEIYFHYNKAQFTKAPIFSSFLLLISQGYITFDWRGRVKPDGTKYKDKGHCFRLKPKYRKLLFAEIEDIDLTKKPILI
ncbi:hypothetical protein COE45_20550 [Bacillus thuringiensis]|uniref:MvaI/BcnI family restriction endonuclease n=1 Tax=Bacillus thuringiensis TaxID=1428 RepID=UPI000BFBB3E7|nr:MvaI/BcnI family restriction endonuclease [Bacillus thuringiensis]PGX79607.1 hypothetical protein COE45_20550 [Bacillus thuringiensis]